MGIGFARAGRSGAQDWMDALFVESISALAPREASPGTLAERRERLAGELPALAAAAAAAVEAA